MDSSSSNIQNISNDTLSRMFRQYIFQRCETGPVKNWMVVPGTDCSGDIVDDIDGDFITMDVYSAIQYVADIFEENGENAYDNLVDMYKPRMRRMTPDEFFEMIISKVTDTYDFDDNEYIVMPFGCVTFNIIETKPMGSWDEFVRDFLKSYVDADPCIDIATHPMYCKLAYYMRSGYESGLAQEVVKFIEDGKVTPNKAFRDIIGVFMNEHIAETERNVIQEVYTKINRLCERRRDIDITDLLLLSDMETHLGSFKSYKDIIGAKAIFTYLFFDEECFNYDLFYEQTNFDPETIGNTPSVKNNTNEDIPFDQNNIDEFRTASWNYFTKVFKKC